MKKIILTVAFIASGMVASAQVGIGNTDPKTTLHVTGANDGGALAGDDGVTVPRVSTDMRDSETPTDGVEVGQLVYSTNASSTGFWYWAGATEKWNPLVAAATAPTVPIRVTTGATISNADLNGYVIYTGAGSASFDLSTLTGATHGNTISFVDVGGNIQVTGANALTRTAPINGDKGTIVYIFVVDTVTPANAGWWNINGF